MDFVITTLAERPELAHADFPDIWPAFSLADPVGRAFFAELDSAFPEFTVVATEADGSVVARGHSVPFALRVEGRGELPPGGWDEVLLWAFKDRRTGAVPDTVSAIDITVREDRLGHGLSALMLDAMRHNARDRGFAELVAPVRPTGKHLEPETPMAEYMRRTREDGLPVDAWLRTHVRAGGVIEAVAPCSMTVSGTLAQWRDWTGLPFDTAGPVLVPKALVPVECLPERDCASYVEPNVWVRHGLA
ncbi:GNAT superfamily N-acetyltransferase [Kitasatospora sp. GP30]|uniref:N-acetyltransferase n=1 Tax=Kitasatospora sp. GP30 TaxID=3035084 RepID=UPI000C6FE667|nr:N-acetyltransferase [Kitasatospora sp. GP30]MDH6144898.1 GNAT superfamily N-acetyltransferase [Kitasatospora sp. GP30]